MFYKPCSGLLTDTKFDLILKQAKRGQVTSFGLKYDEFSTATLCKDSKSYKDAFLARCRRLQVFCCLFYSLSPLGTSQTILLVDLF